MAQEVMEVLGVGYGPRSLPLVLGGCVVPGSVILEDVVERIPLPPA